jgi:hypothetical protein
MATFCEEFPCLGDYLHMASCALLKDLQFSRDAGFLRLQVEFTNNHIKALLLSHKECLTELNDSLVIREFSTGFQSLEFNTISGFCNKTAKVMATIAKEHSEPSIWIEEGLACLLPIVFAELS